MKYIGLQCHQIGDWMAAHCVHTQKVCVCVFVENSIFDISVHTILLSTLLIQCQNFLICFGPLLLAPDTKHRKRAQRNKAKHTAERNEKTFLVRIKLGMESSENSLPVCVCVCVCLHVIWIVQCFYRILPTSSPLFHQKQKKSRFCSHFEINLIFQSDLWSTFFKCIRKHIPSHLSMCVRKHTKLIQSLMGPMVATIKQQSVYLKRVQK